RRVVGRRPYRVAARGRHGDGIRCGDGTSRGTADQRSAACVDPAWDLRRVLSSRTRSAVLGAHREPPDDPKRHLPRAAGTGLRVGARRVDDPEVCGLSLACQSATTSSMIAPTSGGELARAAATAAATLSLTVLRIAASLASSATFDAVRARS